MNFSNQTESKIDRYRRFRAAAKSLVTKLYDAARGPQFDMIKAARKLTLSVQGNTLIFDGDTDMNALADFYLHEMRYGGKRVVELLSGSGSDLTPDERALLEGHIHSRCSLFAIRSSDPVACQIRLQDVLEPSRPDECLMDINLSKCTAVHPGDLLFTRLVHCEGLTMGAGMFFSFPAVHRIHLLNAYAARMRSVEAKERSQRTFIFFYQKNRVMGQEQAYEEVV